MINFIYYFIIQILLTKFSSVVSLDLNDNSLHHTMSTLSYYVFIHYVKSEYKYNSNKL